MSNHDRSPALHDVLEINLDLRPRSLIQGRYSLIKNQDLMTRASRPSMQALEMYPIHGEVLFYKPIAKANVSKGKILLSSSKMMFLSLRSMSSILSLDSDPSHTTALYLLFPLSTASVNWSSFFLLTQILLFRDLSIPPPLLLERTVESCR